MQISPVYTGAPTDAREDVERRVYDLLAELNIPSPASTMREAHDMDACVEISRVLGVDICKNLLLTPRNRSTFYLLCLPGDKPLPDEGFLQADRLVAPELRHGGGSAGAAGRTAGLRVRARSDERPRAPRAALLRPPGHRGEWFGCHPCRNTSSLRLKTRDVLDVFLKHTGHTATVVDL